MQHTVLKTRQRPTSIWVTPAVKRIFYYLENKPFDSRIVVHNGGLLVSILNNFFYDKFQILEPDTHTGELDKVETRYTETLPLLVTMNFHITERSIIRFNRLVEEAFVEHIIRIELALGKYTDVSREAIIKNEIERAGLDDIKTVYALRKTCSRRFNDLNLRSYRIPNPKYYNYSGYTIDR